MPGAKWGRLLSAMRQLDVPQVSASCFSNDGESRLKATFRFHGKQGSDLTELQLTWRDVENLILR